MFWVPLWADLANVCSLRQGLFPEGVYWHCVWTNDHFYGIGMMVSPVLTGYLVDVTGTFKWSFALGGFISFMAVFLIGNLKKPREFGKEKD